MRLVKQLYQYITLVLRTRISRVQYIMIVATLVGLASGLIAVLLKKLVHYLQIWIQQINFTRYAYLLFPIIGLLLTVIIVQIFLRVILKKV